VTGGGGGLGRAVGRRLVEGGASVALLGRTAATVEEEAKVLGALAVTADVTRRAEVEQAVRTVRAELGPVRWLVNGAGIAEAAPLLPPDDALWERTLGVNATGAWITSTAVLPDMLAAGGGAIVNVASTAALRGYRYTAAYVASKHALLGLTRAMAADLGAKGIRVSAVCPGFLDTQMTDRTIARIVRSTGQGAAEARAALASMNASGRLVAPDAVAAAICDLLRDEGRGSEVLTIE
jgi:NAD(P)-dependent dehydrogenase (short-subunit alcohol dehydrogenase family)